MLLKKLNKENYLTLGAYCLIFFLSTLNKILKYLVIQKLAYLYNVYNLFSKNYFDSLKYKNTSNILVIL